MDDETISELAQVASDRAAATGKPVIAATIGDSGRMTILDVNVDGELPPEPPTFTEEELVRLHEPRPTLEELNAWRDRNPDLVEKIRTFIRAQREWDRKRAPSPPVEVVGNVPLVHEPSSES